MRLPLILAACLSTVMVGCSGGGGTDTGAGVSTPAPPPPPPPPPPPTPQSQTDVVYGLGATQTDPKELLLDVYQPDGACTAPRPFALLIHGGGFTGGSKSSPTWQENGRRVSERGIVALSMTYRFEGDGPVISAAFQPFLDALIAEFTPLAGPGDLDRLPAVVAAAEDTVQALNWARDNADELCIDPDQYVIWGSSAGSNTAHNVTYTLDDFGVDVPLPRAVVNFWGGEMLPDPMKPGDPPIFILHGDRDRTVLYSEALDKEDDAQNNGVPYAFYTVLGAGHGWGSMQTDDTRIDGVTLRDLAVDFVAAHLFENETPLYQVRSVDVGENATSSSANLDVVPVGRLYGAQVATLFDAGVTDRGATSDNASLEPRMPEFGGNHLSIELEGDQVGIEDSGINWTTPIEGESNTLHLSYRIQFPADFDFVSGGVLPGFSGRIDTPQSWSLATGWSADGAPVVWVRGPGLGWHGVDVFERQSGEQTVRFEPDRWHSIELAFDTATGKARLYLDGTELLAQTDVGVPSNDRGEANALSIAAFHLGDNITDAPANDQTLRIGDIRWSSRPILAE